MAAKTSNGLVLNTDTQYAYTYVYVYVCMYASVYGRWQMANGEQHLWCCKRVTARTKRMPVVPTAEANRSDKMKKSSTDN